MSNKSNPKNKKKNMFWFKFLVRFLLWVSAIFNLFIGAYYISKNISKPYLLDFQYGMLCCVLFVLFLISIYSLSSFSKHADGLLYFCYIFDILISFLYVFFYSRANVGCDIFVEVKQALISAGGSLLMLIINMIYFSRRDYMFIN